MNSTCSATLSLQMKNFLAMTGYSLQEVQGHHHSMFVEKDYLKSPKYQKFWDDLNNGKHLDKQYKRLGKGGRELWLQASYDPIFDAEGKPFKVVKYFSDDTQWKLEDASALARSEAINNAQAVLELNIDGSIVTANENFLASFGYELSEIKGKHHSILVDLEYSPSLEYKEFWQVLKAGNFQAGEFKNLGKGNKEVWLNGPYSPIPDLSGKPYKVIAYAIDITEKKQLQSVVESLLGEVSTVMLSLAEGDLSQRIKGTYSGQFKLLKDAVKQYCNKINEIVVNIREASELESSGADEISRGNLDLSRRTESQAASLGRDIGKHGANDKHSETECR